MSVPMADEKTVADELRGPHMTHTQTIERQRAIKSEMDRLAELEIPTDADEVYLEELRSEFFELDNHRRVLERRAKVAQVAQVAERIDVRDGAQFRSVGRPQPVLGSGSADSMDLDPILEPDSVEVARFRNPHDLRTMSTFDKGPEAVTSEFRARAKCAIAGMKGTTDRVREAATQMVERWDDEHGSLSRLALTLSDPTYLRAWSRLARNPMSVDLDEDERRAIARVNQSARAMSLTDNAGGYLVPFQLDPTVIITANGSINEIRQAAKQVVATGDVWNGVSSGAVSWSYDAEAAQVSDDTTTFAQPTIPIYKAQGFVPISIEALQDAANVTTEVGNLLAFGKDVLEAGAFATGSGSNQPTGIVTALTGTSSIVTSITGDTFALADVYAVHGALPGRYRRSASWLANTLIWNKVRQFDTAGGGGLWTQLASETPNGLLNRPVLESEDMDGTYGSGENYVAVFGDFQNYVIADRIGATVEFIPHLFSTSNGRPTNQRGWLAYCRHGADSVNDGAFRMLNIT